MNAHHKQSVSNAIIVAAGMGRRLSPITDTTPKPLITVNGHVIIETLINTLVESGITNIVIVVGHMKEKFTYLVDMHTNATITLIANPHYNECNNISSLYAARNYIGNSIILDGDIIIKNKEILCSNFESSGYCSAWTESGTTEWLQTVDDDGVVLSCKRNGGNMGWQLFSISFWNHEDGMKLKNHLEDVFIRRNITDVYWDDIPMFLCNNEYKLKIRQIRHDDLIEIDNLHELVAIDSSYQKYVEDFK